MTVDNFDATGARRAFGAHAGIILTLITASGMLPGTMMPVVVTVARARLGYTLADAGLLAGIDVAGAACGALLVAIIGVPARWRWPAAAAIAATIGCDLISAGLVSAELGGFAPLLAVRALRGIAGGVVMGMGYTAIGRLAARDRLFGLLLVTQFLLGALAIGLLPAIVISKGAWLLFAIFAGFQLVMLALLPFAPQPPHRIVAREAAGATPPVLRTLCALFLFEAAHTAASPYIIEFGRQKGLPLIVAQQVAGSSAAAGALGALIVVLIGGRFGRAAPIVIATAVGLLAGLLIVLHSGMAFIAGAVIGTIAWGCSIPYVLALCTLGSPRGAAWASFVAKLGLAAGPVLGGLVAQPGRYAPAVLLSCLLSIAALPLLARGRARAPGRTTPPQPLGEAL